MDRIVLIGYEEVSRAGHNMQSAANDMKSAASQIDDALERQRRFMDDWLMRFEEIVTRKS